MPGIRDKNLRSGDLNEEFGITLLKEVALVAPVPRQEDIGYDALVTLIRPDGGRRLIPESSFLVQLKSASETSVRYATPDAVNWIEALEFPLLIGRVDRKKHTIELYTTLRLHHILLEHRYEQIELLLDSSDEVSDLNIRRVNIGPPIHTWSLVDTDQPDFQARCYAILKPHVETLRRNRSLRDIQYQKWLKWSTGQPPENNGEMILVSGGVEVAATLRDMAPHARRLLMELFRQKKYGDLPILLAFFDMMRRWGADPDPDGTLRALIMLTCGGAEISVRDAIVIRCAASHERLVDLGGLLVRDEDLVILPTTVTALAVVNCPLTDAGIPNLLRLTGLRRLNIAGTKITDEGAMALLSLAHLEWVCLNRTLVTPEGVVELKKTHPKLEVVIGSEPNSGLAFTNGPTAV